MIAEQIRKLDGEVDGTMKTFLEQTRLTEKPGRGLDEQAMIKNLLADHESIMAILNDDIQFMMDNADEGTADMLIETLRSHQKMAWMLRSMVQ